MRAHGGADKRPRGPLLLLAAAAAALLVAGVTRPFWPDRSGIPVTAGSAPSGSSPTTALALADQLLVKFKAGTPAAVRDALIAQVGARKRKTIAAIGVSVIGVAAQRRGNVLASLRASPRVAYAEPDLLAQEADTIPNDAGWPQQWGQRVVEAPRAWDTSRGASTVVVAVLDTGIDAGHADLRQSTVAGYDFVNGDAGPTDDEGHGTAVASVLAARTNNGEGIAGTCWLCSLMPVKVLGADGYGSHSAIASGIVWAADHGAQVINLSLGGAGSTQTLADAVAYAAGKGAVILAAAGNNGVSTPFYPAAYPGVVGVAATDSADHLYSWSNYGAWVDVAAPGCNRAALRGGGYADFCGTSAATPVVAGVAGLALALKPGAVKEEVELALEGSAVSLAGAVEDGRVNAARAVSGLLASSAVPAVTTVVSPTATFQLRRELAVAWTAAAAVASYDVRYRRAGPGGGFGSYLFWRAATTATSGVFGGSPGSTYCFSARARDVSAAAGFWSAEACTSVPLNDTALARDSRWSSRTGAGYYLGTFSLSSQRGAVLTRGGLEARRVALVVSRCPGCGTVRVFWNGTLLKEIRLTATEARTKQIVTVASFASVRSGKVAVEIVSSGKPVKVEGLAVSRL